MKYIHLFYAVNYLFNAYYHDFYDKRISRSLGVDQMLYIDGILKHGLSHSMDLASYLHRLSIVSHAYRSKCANSNKVSQCQQHTLLLGPCGGGYFLQTDSIQTKCSWTIDVKTQFTSIWLVLNNIALHNSALTCPRTYLQVVETKDNNDSMILARLCGISRDKQYFSHGNIMQLYLLVTEDLQLGYGFMNSTISFSYQAVSANYISDIETETQIAFDIETENQKASAMNIQLLRCLHYDTRLTMIHINTYFTKVIHVSLEQHYNDHSSIYVFDGLSSNAILLGEADRNMPMNYTSSLFVISILVQDWYAIEFINYTTSVYRIRSDTIRVTKSRTLVVREKLPLYNIRYVYKFATAPGLFMNVEILKFNNYGFTEFACYTGGLILHTEFDNDTIGSICGTYGMSSFNPDMKGVTFSSNIISIFVFVYKETGGLDIRLRLSSSSCVGVINHCETRISHPIFLLHSNQLMIKQTMRGCVRLHIMHTSAQRTTCSYLNVIDEGLHFLRAQIALSMLRHLLTPAQCAIKAITLLRLSTYFYELAVDSVTGLQYPVIPADHRYNLQYDAKVYAMSAVLFTLIPSMSCVDSLDIAASIIFTTIDDKCPVHTFAFNKIDFREMPASWKCIKFNIQSPSYGILYLFLPQTTLSYDIIFTQQRQCSEDAKNTILIIYRYPNHTIAFVWDVEYGKTRCLVASNRFVLSIVIAIYVSLKREVIVHSFFDVDRDSKFQVPACNYSSTFFKIDIDILPTKNDYHNRLTNASK